MLRRKRYKNRNGMQLICVTLNDYNWFNDSKTLLEKGFAEYTMVSLFEENKVAGVCNILDGKEETRWKKSR